MLTNQDALGLHVIVKAAQRLALASEFAPSSEILIRRLWYLWVGPFYWPFCAYGKSLCLSDTFLLLKAKNERAWKAKYIEAMRSLRKLAFSWHFRVSKALNHHRHNGLNNQQPPRHNNDLHEKKTYSILRNNQVQLGNSKHGKMFIGGHGSMRSKVEGCLRTRTDSQKWLFKES